MGKKNKEGENEVNGKRTKYNKRNIGVKSEKRKFRKKVKYKKVFKKLMTNSGEKDERKRIKRVSRKQKKRARK